MAKASKEWVRLTVHLEAPDAVKPAPRFLERLSDVTITRKVAIDLLRTIADDLEAGPVSKYRPGRAEDTLS